MPEIKTKEKTGTGELVHAWEFPAPPPAVYQALLDSVSHAMFTGMQAWIDPRPGGWFRTCGNKNFGYTLSVRKDRRLVQAWSHKTFPEGHYSIADFRISPLSGDRSRLVFVHTGFPAGAKKWLDTGWKSTYWKPLEKWLTKYPIPRVTARQPASGWSAPRTIRPPRTARSRSR